ncbi:MAG: GNAT family N-acetyltransferase [Bacteroidales bacterium]|nr:GNAT family N-acetyltransferase [Bacteroidales bacterium]
MNEQLLQTNRIVLRAPEPSDVDFMLHIENDTRLWYISACKVPYSRYQLQRYIRENYHDIYADKQLRLMIEERNSHKIVGIIDLFDYSPLHHRAEVGIVLATDSRSNGYAQEALTQLCHYAKQILHIHQLYAYVFSNNNPACKLFEKCEFMRTAELRDWGYNGDKFQNAYLYQLIL